MKQVLALVTVMVMACPVLAQETTGAIIGTIKSQDGAPLPGVNIQLEDTERGFSRSAVSAANGGYNLVALPPARYQLTASLDKFQAVQRAVKVDLGRTVTNDIEMKVGAVTQAIEVSGETPQVDVQSTVSGLTVNTDELNDRIPVGREATQIALLAPTAVASDTAFNGERGFTPGQNVASIGGASAAENLYVVNGLNITNFRNMVGSTFVPFEFLEEVQVKTGGYQAEFGRSMGGVLNMVTKSGSNTLRGHASLYFSPESLQEQEPDTFNGQHQDESARSLEANASIGGPIARDRLFFFAFVRYDDTAGSEIDGDRMTVNRNNAPYYGAKVDWNITPSHRVEGTYLYDGTGFEYDSYVWNIDDRLRERYLGTGTNTRGGSNWILKYTGLLTDSFLLAAQYGVNDFGRSKSSTADDDCPTAWDFRVNSWTQIGCWVNWAIWDGGDERTAYRADLDWYLGKHSLRGGLDHEDLTSGGNAIYSGGRRYEYRLNGGDWYDPRLPDGADIVGVWIRETDGTYDTTTAGIYVQDSWAVSSAFTLNFGLRWERYENFNTEGEAFVTIDDQYAPRVGFVWDPSKRGRQKVFGSFGQYHIPIASDTTIRLAGLDFFVKDYYEVTNQGPNGDPFNADGSPTGLGLRLYGWEESDGSPPDVQSLVASNLDPMSQLEYILGYEQMVGTDWSLGARFVHRRFEQVIEDFWLDQALFEKYGVCGGACWQIVLGNPGSSFEGFYDLDGDGVNDPISFTAEELGLPEAQRDYYAVELMANKRFSNNWLLQASYVWSQLYGYYEGYLNSDVGQADPGSNEDFDFAGLMDNKYGFLPNDRRHNLKVFGSYAWDTGLQVGGFFSWRTGRPINALAVHPTDFWASLYGASSFFEQVTEGARGAIPSPRGSQGTTDDVMAFDAMVRYDLGAAGIDWWLRLDVFNLFNQQSNIQVYEFSGTSSGGLDPGFLQTTYYQPPRTVRFGIGLSF